MAALSILKNSFKAEVSEASEPVIVDFWAPWCGFCRRLSPVVERIADEYEGKLKVAKLNIDEHPEVTEQYQVDTIPTLILFHNGNAIDSLVNPPSQDAIDEWLKENGAL